jgi:hypothetical protein
MTTHHQQLRTAICALTVALGLAICAPQLLAASPSPSPASKSAKASTSPSPSPADPPASADASTVQEDIKNRIQQVIDQNKTNTSTDHQIKRAIVGQVQKINAESITIKTLHSTETARVADGSTVILSMPSMQAAQEADVELDAYVIAMGFVADDGVVDVHRLLISPLPLFPPDRKIVLGTLQTNTAKSITILTRDNQQVLVPLSTKTRYEDTDGNKAGRTDFKLNSSLFVSIENPTSASSAAALVRMLK